MAPQVVTPADPALSATNAATSTRPRRQSTRPLSDSLRANQECDREMYWC